MSLTALVWLGLFIIFTVMTFRRSSWGIPLYMMTFYTLPAGWWWGKSTLAATGIRWNLAAALIMAVAVLLDLRRKPRDVDGATGRVLKVLLLYAIGATFVHFLFASPSAEDMVRSYEGLTLIWKQLGLLLLMCLAMRDEFDVKLMIYSLIIGAGYVGYEVIINERGGFHGSRLEGIFIPGAAESNYMAGLFCLSLVLAGGLLLIGTRREKVAAFLVLPFIFDVILRCNSRGAFLALILAGAWLVWSAKGHIRRYAIVGIALGCLAGFLLIGDVRIQERFLTTFAGSEDRDASAEMRLTLWTQALEMLQKHPFGSGSEAAFKSDRGVRYMYKVGIPGPRAVHNGYLDIAVSWGIQGLIIYLIAIYLAWRRLRAGIRHAASEGDERTAFLGVCMEAALITQLGVCVFISSLDGEWFFWWIALALAYERILVVDKTEARQEEELEELPDWEPDQEEPQEMAVV